MTVLDRTRRTGRLIRPTAPRGCPATSMPGHPTRRYPDSRLTRCAGYAVAAARRPLQATASSHTPCSRVLVAGSVGLRGTPSVPISSGVHDADVTRGDAVRRAAPEARPRARAAWASTVSVNTPERASGSADRHHTKLPRE